MNILSYIIWTANPDIFVIPWLNHPLRWYGLLFAVGFILSQQVLLWIFKKEGKPEKHVEAITGYMVVATIIGARLGHCLFYDPVYFLSNPLEILMVWKGGLASHGGALGILFALFLFCRKYNYSYLWILDRIVIVVALTGAMIRTGNLFNSEMEGTATDANMGIVYARASLDVLNYDESKIDKVWFEQGGEMVSDEASVVPITAFIQYNRGVKLELADKNKIENLKSVLDGYREAYQHVDFGTGPLNYKIYSKGGREMVEIAALGTVRHAAQLYEAVYCLILLGLLFWLWYKKRETLPQGFNFALFMILLWSLRFVDEFFKMNQEAFEEGMILNMGQILSIPLTIAGIALMIWIHSRDKKMIDM